jgi:hypothetical protein
MIEVERRLDYAFEYLKESFGYHSRLEFIADPEVVTEEYQRMFVMNGELQVFDEVIKIPTKFLYAGRFVGDILHMQVNPSFYLKAEANRRKFRIALRANVKDEDLPIEILEERVTRELILRCCGRAVAEAQNEVIEKEDIQIFHNPLFCVLYHRAGIGLISEIARLDGAAARLKILDKYEIDIAPGIEQ